MNHAIYTARILVVALLIPLLLATLALIVGFSLAAHNPGSVPVHWGLDGRVDGYGSPYELPIVFAAVCLPLIAIFGGAVVLTSHRGPLTPLAKVLAVSSTWITLFIGMTFVAVLLDPASGSRPATIVGVSLAASTLVSAGEWFVLPPGVRGVAGKTRPAPQPIALAPGERAAWIRTSTASRGVIGAVVGVCILLSVVTSVAVVSSGGRDWALSFLPLVVLVIVLSNFAWTVRVDGRGVRIRAVLGLPVFMVPLDQITSADVTDIQALSQYGGYGVRIALNRRMGIILRSGEALEIHRTKGLDLVVTVDDAAAAAALINGLVQRKAHVLP
jgi:Protein of unknown function (DUF1648)